MIIRSLEDKDTELLQYWISKEPEHAINTPEFYNESGTKSTMYEDVEGPVFCVKYTPAIIVDIEFNPDASKQRIRDAMVSGFPEVAAQAKQQGFKQLIFSSVSKSLIAFCRAFGFEATPDYRKVL
jgi:hypothetical protein